MGRELALQPDPEPVAGRIGQVELGTEVPLGGLDALVPEGELDLL